MRAVQLLIPVLAIYLTAVCSAKNFPLTAASIVPGARGKVEIGKDRNKNTEVKMNVEHLATPDSLSPAKSVYVVWLQEKGAEAENTGQLRVNKNLQGSFKTVTSHKTFDIFVTGEQDAGVKTPVGPEVLRATVQP